MISCNSVRLKGWIMIRYSFCALMCLVGALLLGVSDALINSSASEVVGNNETSRASARYVAIGVTIALAAIGGVITLVKNDFFKFCLGIVAVIAALFSAGLTVQGTSIDYAANEHNGSIQHDRRSKNSDKIDAYKEELGQLKKKMKECERDNYYLPCRGTERRIATITDKIADISDDSVKSKVAQKVDITDAIEGMSGLDPVAVQRGIIFSRAFAVPLLISVLSWGFWSFVHLIFGEWKPKQRNTGTTEQKPKQVKKKTRRSWLRAA